MAARPEALLRYIRRIVVRPEAGADADAGLLGRFVAEGDEEAFAALVERHGPLVLQVCWRVLGNLEDAEDAFQATFLVLARKAAAVQPPQALPAWLHGVARHAALKVRAARARHGRHARPLAAPAADPRPGPLAELSAQELLAIVDEEVRRLPEVYRLPVILCCLQGRSLEEAARQLGWTTGSLKGRLERGRARLHARLLRRGLTLSAALAAAEVSRGAASAVVAAELVAGTARAAVLFASRRAAAGGVSQTAVALAGEVLRGMALARMKLPAALLLAVCLLATGLLARQAMDSTPPQAEPGRARAEDRAAERNGRNPAPPNEQDAPVEVKGLVLDPAGRPFAGARLYVGHSPRPTPFAPNRQAAAYRLRATSGPDGRFQFTFARSELDARLLDVSRPAVIAVANGHGPDWAVIEDVAREVEVSLKLVPDQPLDGRIVGPDRKPVGGASVWIDSILSAPEADVARYLAGGLNSWSPKVWMGPLPGLPTALTTDADGRFRAAGIGRDRIVQLVVEAPSIQHARLTAVTRPAAGTPFVAGVQGATFEYSAAASRPIWGVVRDRRTGNPVPGVQMVAADYFATISTAVTDQQGRYELAGYGKSHQGCTVTAQPQAGQPYFTASERLPESPGPHPITLNFDLVSGILVRGRVTDQATQKPPRAAVVEYYPLFPNAHSAKLTNGMLAASSAAVQPDGSYRLVVLPGPGILCVAASPWSAYAVAVLDRSALAGLLNDGKRPADSFPNGGLRPLTQNPETAVGAGGRGVACVNRYHALALLRPEEKVESLVFDFHLQPARTLRGSVVGPDGKPLAGVEVVGLIPTPEAEVLEGAVFTVTGLNPRRSRELFFHHKGMGLGKYLIISGDEAKPLAVQLVPCGRVVGRVVDWRGRPVPGVVVGFSRPGDGYVLPITGDSTDKQGRFRLENVAPGPRYLLTQNSSRRLLKEVGAVEVEAGRVRDLGELVLDD